MMFKITLPVKVIWIVNFLACHFTCKNCTDKGLNQCTICDSTANRVISTEADGSFCRCALHYYEIQTPECACIY